MVDSPLSLELLATDPASAARRGILHTPHGAVQLPAFMPVGTQATVKGCTIDMLRATGAELVLGNAYHLAVRPGADVIEELGGLHHFMGWDGPILTDSGGFQVFSLERLCRVTDEAVEFRSHVDGRLITLSPERVGADPGVVGQRRGHGVGSRGGVAERTGGHRGRVSADRRVGRAVPRRRPAARLRDCLRSSRAGWIPPCVAGVPSNW